MREAPQCFYMLYLIVEVPSNFVFKKFGSMYLAFLVIGFGATSIGAGLVNADDIRKPAAAYGSYTTR